MLDILRKILKPDKKRNNKEGVILCSKCNQRKAIVVKVKVIGDYTSYICLECNSIKKKRDKRKRLIFNV